MQQELKLSLQLEGGVVVSGSVDQISRVPARRSFEFRQLGAMKNKALDLDAVDSQGNFIHWPLTAWDDGKPIVLSDHEAAKSWLFAKYHPGDEFAPESLEWIPNSDYYIQVLLSRGKSWDSVIEYVSSAAVATLEMQDEIFLVDDAGRIVSVIDPKTNQPREGVLECEGFTGGVLEFTQWLKQKYPIEFDGRLPSGFAIHRLLRPSGAIEEVCYRHVYGRDLGLTPGTLEISFTPASDDPEPEHTVRRAYVVLPSNTLVSFNPEPGTEADWLPIAVTDKTGFAHVIRGLHGNEFGIGVIQALMDFDPPPDADTWTDPRYHWQYAGNGLWFESIRPGGGVLEIRATHLFTSEKDFLAAEADGKV